MDLNNLAELYKERVEMLIKSLQDKTVVFDFDGTLTEFKYDTDKLLPCKNDELDSYSVRSNIYDNVHVLETIKYIISQLDKDNVYIITKSVNNIKKKKDGVIHSHFDIEVDHVHHVTSLLTKMQALKKIHDKTSADIVYVEDNVEYILKAEGMFNFVHGMHVSSLLP